MPSIHLLECMLLLSCSVHSCQWSITASADIYLSTVLAVHASNFLTHWDLFHHCSAGCHAHARNKMWYMKNEIKLKAWHKEGVCLSLVVWVCIYGVFWCVVYHRSVTAWLISCCTVAVRWFRERGSVLALCRLYIDIQYKVMVCTCILIYVGYRGATAHFCV